MKICSAICAARLYRSPEKNSWLEWAQMGDELRREKDL